MRRILLWCARNRWMRTHVPRLPGMRRAGRRFMPGETMDGALTAGGATVALASALRGQVTKTRTG